ncbi:MAG: hypothetical protein ACREL3_00615 [Gemmatimonadales bacterium]
MICFTQTARCFAGGVLLAAVAACGGGAESGWVVPTQAGEQGGQPIHITGVVTHLELEGGLYAIRGDDEVTYDPTNLPPEFQKDGLAVEAEGRRRENMASIHQVGPIVEIERIRRR